MKQSPCQGVGLGLRTPHLYEVLERRPEVDWFEVHICNFLGGGRNRELLRRIAEHYPLSFHGVNLNLGGADPLDAEYLRLLNTALTEFSPVLVSEHACFTSHRGRHYHDLLPLPFTEEALNHCVARVDAVQTYLARPILVENLSRYHRYPQSCLREGEFLNALSERTGCGILLDLNNAYVNEQNLGEPVGQLLTDLAPERIGEIHLAGFSQRGNQLVDSHSAPVSREVWALLESALTRFATPPPCLIEWDSQLPALSVLLEERSKACQVLATTTGERDQWGI